MNSNVQLHKSILTLQKAGISKGRVSFCFELISFHLPTCGNKLTNKHLQGMLCGADKNPRRLAHLMSSKALCGTILDVCQQVDNKMNSRMLI